MRGFNLDHLQTFADVVRLGSFSAAAARLNLTQPAVSLQVRQLELKLGLKLIERVGRKATPTAAGRALLQHAGGIDAAVNAALEDVAQHGRSVIGRVRIGIGATACIHILPPILSDLRRRFPELDLMVNTGNAPEILRAIEDNSLDLGLVTLPPNNKSLGRALDVTPLIDDDFVAIAPKAMKLPDPVTPAMLMALPLVIPEPGGNTRSLIDGWFAAAGFTPKAGMELDSVEAIKQLVGAGLGCSVLPGMALTTPESRRGLEVRALKPRLTRQLALVLRRDKPLSRGLRETIAALRGLKRRSR
ncbi:LysR family transcriptional regulator [Ferrovibrio terrae]|uniref:LysR family transcriptional regulator n=1 Tax=Ferrovibrio terrae TaxID=2594003 RepID=A0A516H0A6_9PROT|nr:LysR family transcriptional regulator [Ferrovibrio terrae]QDO97020.1 LysR family transcriptional regulator [Ferrovibrio terrae]